MSRIPDRLEPLKVMPEVNPAKIRIPGNSDITTLEPLNIISSDQVLNSLLADVAAEIQTVEGDGRQPPNPPVVTQIGGRSPDSCAHYLSFRFGSSWGIYIRRECLISLAEFLHLNGVSKDVAAREAFIHLYAHEYFHFAVDSAMLPLERVHQLTTGRLYDFWMSYLRINNPCELEEALANGFAYEVAGAIAGPAMAKNVRRCLAFLMRNQPPGYCDYGRVLGSKKKAKFRAYLLTRILASPSVFIPDLDRLISLPSKGKLKKGLPKVDFEGMPLRVFVI